MNILPLMLACMLQKQKEEDTDTLDLKDCFEYSTQQHAGVSQSVRLQPGVGGGGSLGISGWRCAAGTPEPLAYTRASSAEFCYPILE